MKSMNGVGIHQAVWKLYCAYPSDRDSSDPVASHLVPQFWQCHSYQSCAPYISSRSLMAPLGMLAEPNTGPSFIQSSQLLPYKFFMPLPTSPISTGSGCRALILNSSHFPSSFFFLAALTNFFTSASGKKKDRKSTRLNSSHSQ